MNIAVIVVLVGLLVVDVFIVSRAVVRIRLVRALRAQPVRVNDRGRGRTVRRGFAGSRRPPATPPQAVVPDPEKGSAMAERVDDRRPLPVDVEVVGGRVAPADEAYAWEALGDLWRHSTRAIQRGCAHLCAGVDDNGRSVVAVDALLVLDRDLVICGGAVALTMHDAIDQLSARLQPRLLGLPEGGLATVSVPTRKESADA